MEIQPSPTSRDIITTKPRMEVQDASFPLPLVTHSDKQVLANEQLLRFDTIVVFLT